MGSVGDLANYAQLTGLDAVRLIGLIVKAAGTPWDRLCSGHGAVECPHGGEVWGAADPVWRHVALGERGAATGIALVILLLLSSRALRLRHDGP